MIAKLIVHSNTRGEALARLAGVLDGVEVWPVKTNAAFLAEAVSHPEFIAAEVDTGFIPRHIDTLVPPAEPDESIWRLAAVAMAETEFEAVDQTGPWPQLAGFRLNAPDDDHVALSHRGETRVIDRAAPGDMAAGSATWADKLVVFYQGQAFGFDWPGSAGGAAGSASDGTLLSPMPGRVIGVDVRQGDSVKAGQKLLTLEAMKMEHSLAAPFDGIVAELHASEGAQVTEGTVLARVEKAS